MSEIVSGEVTPAGGAAGWEVLVHGGAGSVPEAMRARHEAGCRAAAEAGAAVFRAGGSALDAVQRAVECLEDDPVFNAGTGGSLTATGGLELDAALMEGRELRAGGVCSLGPCRHPIAVARAVLEDGRHVFYAGPGADRFARRAGIEAAEPAAMITDAARAKLAATLRSGRPESWAGDTVGAVARDRAGNLAAGTSTGGMMAKLPGRVGDSPIVGAGLIADNGSGAVSVTGEGEGILRLGVAHRVLEALRAGVDARSAAERVLAMLHERTLATGGLILVGAGGELVWARTTTTMSWAAVREKGAAASGT